MRAILRYDVCKRRTTLIVNDAYFIPKTMVDVSKQGKPVKKHDGHEFKK